MTAGNGHGHQPDFQPFSLMGFPELPEKTTNVGTVRFSTGAVRSSDAESTRYDLISPIGLRRLAETYAEGAKKYSDHNWLKGFPSSCILNHLMKHVDQWRMGDKSEDHLAHAAWGLFALMHFEETRPDLISLPPWKGSDAQGQKTCAEITQKDIAQAIAQIYGDDPGEARGFSDR